MQLHSGNNITHSQYHVETPRLTRFRLARNSLQHGFGLGTKKFT